MQYLHDNLKMHIIYEGKMQYPHYDLNPYYIWQKEMQYLHDNLWMHTIFCCKFVDGGASTSATFKLGHININ
jgi:hypothetical protein